MIIINANINEDVIANLINDMFEDMLREYEWEQETRWEREAIQTLNRTEKDLEAYYKAGDVDRFEELYSFYSDYYKDVYGVRPRWFLESQPWFHGRPWFNDYMKRRYGRAS